MKEMGRYASLRCLALRALPSLVLGPVQEADDSPCPSQDDVRLVDNFKARLGELMSNLPEDWEASRLGMLPPALYPFKAHIRHCWSKDLNTDPSAGIKRRF